MNSKALAVRTGLEPATPGVTGRYSNQLNYRTNVQTFEPMEGVEPTTPRLQITCSGQLSYIGSFALFFQWGCKDITFYDTSYMFLIIFSIFSLEIEENYLICDHLLKGFRPTISNNYAIMNICSTIHVPIIWRPNRVT